MINIRKAPIALVLAVALSSIAFAQPRQAAPELKDGGIEISVMSFNIRFGSADDGENRWEKRKELVFDVLREHEADVVCLQEALDWQIDQIRRALPAYQSLGVGRDDGKRAGEFAAILYLADRFKVAEQGTFWLSDTPDVPGSRSWGNRIPRVCTYARFKDKGTELAFYVYNLHLDHKSQPSRERSVELLADRISRRQHGVPVVVAGDFNAAEDNPAVLFLTGKIARIDSGRPPRAPSPGLVDTFRVLHLNAEEVGTFNGFRGTTRGPKIDYIFALKDTKVLEATILHDNQSGRYPSDHFPVFAKLRIVELPKTE